MSDVNGEYSKKKICSNCGAENPLGYLLCRKCGEVLKPSDWEMEMRERKIKEGERGEEKERMRGRKGMENPAIPGMVVGCILVIVGLILVILASADTPTPPSEVNGMTSGEYYANQLQARANIICLGGVIELVGFLVFMVSTIYGVSWNARYVHSHETERNKPKYLIIKNPEYVKPRNQL